MYTSYKGIKIRYLYASQTQENKQRQGNKNQIFVCKFHPEKDMNQLNGRLLCNSTRRKKIKKRPSIKRNKTRQTVFQVRRAKQQGKQHSLFSVCSARRRQLHEGQVAEKINREKKGKYSSISFLGQRNETARQRPFSFGARSVRRGQLAEGLCFYRQEYGEETKEEETK